MILLPALLVVLHAGRFDHPPLRDDPKPFDPDAAVSEFGKSCQPPKGPRCAVLRQQMEAVYLSDLLERRAAGETLDPSLYRAALNAENPFLVVLGMRGLAKRHNLTEDEIRRGIEDPRFAVRGTAIRFADPSVAARLEKRRDPAVDSDSEGGWLRGVRDPDPSEAELGAAVYPGSKLRYFATGPHRWFFTTTDAPDKVVAFYSKGGKKVVTAADLKKMGTQKPDMAAIMAAAQSDPQAMMREMQAAAMTPRTDWTGELDGKPGVVEARYVVVAEAKSFGGTIPTSVVMVFKDEVLGATAVVFPRSTQPRIDPPTFTRTRSK